MARHSRRIIRKSSGRRRKTLWSQSSLGGAVSALPNTVVATGWMAFPAGQYDLSFSIPAFQPEDLTHVRSLLWRGAAYDKFPSTDRGSSYTFGYGVLPFEAEDGNAYQNAIVATSGIGSVPSPVTISNWDWLWIHRDIVPSSQFGSLVAAWYSTDLNDLQSQTRGMRKLSHGMGLLFVCGWDWDDPSIAGNGDTLKATFEVSARSIYKEP